MTEWLPNPFAEKPRAFVNVLLDSGPVVSVTSPLCGSVCVDVVSDAGLDATREGIKLLLKGELVMAWTASTSNNSATQQPASPSISPAAAVIAIGSMISSAVGASSSAPPPSYDGFDKVSTGRTKSASGKKEVWSYEIQVAEPQTIPSGTHTFEFKYSPPRNLIPPFTHTTPDAVACELRYFIVAIIPHKSAPLSLKSSEVLFCPTLPPLDLRQEPALEASRTSGFLYGRLGETVTTILRSPRSTYASGDDSGYFLLHVKNDSARKMSSMNIQLIQRVALSIPSAGTKVFKRILYQHASPGVRAGEVGQKIIKMEIPTCAPTVNLPSISISYEMHISARMGAAAASEVRAYAPLIIVSNGQGLILSDSVQVEEEQLSKNRSPFTNVMPIDSEGFAASELRNELDEVGQEDTTRDIVQPAQGSALGNGAKPLLMDSWQSGEVSLQASDLYYFDVGADVEIASMNFESDDDASSIAPSVAGNPNLRLRGVPGVRLIADAEAGLRISKDAVPTWRKYDLTEESRSQSVDMTQESCARLSLGPGRYYIAVVGNTVMTSVGYRIAVTRIHGLLSRWWSDNRDIAEVDETNDRDTLDLVHEREILGTWVPARKNEIPVEAWAVGKDLDDSPLYVARAWIYDGLHIGKAGPHLETAMIPYDGKEMPVEGEYEVLCQIPGARWVQQLGHGVPPNAIPGGNESDGRLLYIGRAPVSKTGWGSLMDSRKSLSPGKCGPHLGSGCTVPFNGKEVEVSPFEVLVYEGPTPGASGSSRSPARLENTQPPFASNSSSPVWDGSRPICSVKDPPMGSTAGPGNKRTTVVKIRPEQVLEAVSQGEIVHVTPSEVYDCWYEHTASIVNGVVGARYAQKFLELHSKEITSDTIVRFIELGGTFWLLPTVDGEATN